MLTKERFCIAMDFFNKIDEQNCTFEKFFKTILDGNFIYKGNTELIVQYINLLSYFFNDSELAERLINSWLYETDTFLYKQKDDNSGILVKDKDVGHKVMQLKIEGKEVLINNTEDLYDILVKLCK